MAQKDLIILEEAAEKYNLPPDFLAELAQSDRIAVGELDGRIALWENRIKRLVAERDKSGEALDCLITLEEAAEKYDLPPDFLAELARSDKVAVGELDGRVVLREDRVKRLAAERNKSSGLLDCLITLEEAAEKYHFSLEALTKLTRPRRGKIRAWRLNGQTAVREDEIRRIAETRNRLREQVSHLDGQPIGMSEGARKYGLEQPSISRWAEAGYIRVIERKGPGDEVLVNEADVKYAKLLTEHRGKKSGRKVFAPEYVPHFVSG